MIKQREIHLMRFPFSDGENCKLRPAVVASNTNYNESQLDILACPITSKMKETQYSVLLDNDNLEEGKLKKPCRIRCDKLGSVEKELLVHRIGTLDKETFEELKTEVFALLAE